MKRILYVSEKMPQVVRNDEVYYWLSTQTQKSNKDNIIPIMMDSEEFMPLEDVWSLVKLVNERINEITEVTGHWKYEVSYHVEGSGFQQSVSDCMLLLKVIAKEVESNSINSIVIVPCKKNILVSRIVKCVACKRKIPIKYKLDSLYGIFNVIDHPIIKTTRFFVLFSRRMFSWKQLWRKGGKKIEKDEKHYDVGICMESDDIKNMSTNDLLIEQIDKSNLTYNVICIDADEAYNRYLQRGGVAARSEDWLEKEEIKKGWITWCRLVFAYHKYFEEEKWCYQDIDITEIINYYVDIHFLWQLFYAFEKSIKYECYLKYNKFSIVEVYAGSNFIGAKSLYHFTRNYNSILFRVDDIELECLGEYLPYADMIQLRFLIKDSRKDRYLRKIGYKGIVKYIPTMKFKNKSQVNERNRNIQQDIINVLWAPSYPLLGHSSKYFFEECCQKLVDLTEKRNDICLHIKWHPGQNLADVKKYEKEHVIIYDEKMSAVECMKENDIVLTNKSSLIFEAIDNQIPIVSIYDDMIRKTIRDIEGAVTMYCSVDEFFNTLDEHIKLGDLECWKNSILEKQNQYLKEHMTEKEAAQIITEQLSKLKRRFAQ